MSPILHLPWLAAVAGTCVLPAQEEHYSRPPEVISHAGAAVSAFAIATDAELTVALYQDGASQELFATTNDGRALPADNVAGSGWSTPVLVSSAGQVGRRLQRDSIHVVGDRAYAVWLDDAAGPASTRLHARVLQGNAWSAEQVLSAGVPVGADVEQFAVVCRRGLSGPTAVHILAVVDIGGTDELVLAVSTDAGAAFRPFVPVASAVAPGRSIAGCGLDTQLGELYVAWHDDRNGRQQPWFRRGIVDFLGVPRWLGGDTLLDASAVVAALGAPRVAVGGSQSWTGSNRHVVSVVWRRDDGDGTVSLQQVFSADAGATISPARTVAHTDTPAVSVADFDLEVAADEAIVLWEDNAAADGQGGVTVLPAGRRQVWRAETRDAVTFDPVQQLSAQGDPTAFGRRPKIARTHGAPDGTMAVFLEENAQGVEVRSAFADQVNGTEWHDEYPQVSRAQAKAPGTQLLEPDVAYNARYYNFAVAWRQETGPQSGVFELIVGGYRPPEVELAGWYQGSNEFQFFIRHLPFQDNYGFVLVALGADHAPGGNWLLGDGRKTGLVFDAFSQIALDNFQWFFGPNEPANEGVVTTVLPLTIPPGLPLGLELCYAAISWGPYAELHVVTDFQRSALGPPAGN